MSDRDKSASRATSELLAIMSHEMRTPLHAILSFAQLGEQRAASLTPEPSSSPHILPPWAVMISRHRAIFSRELRALLPGPPESWASTGAEPCPARRVTERSKPEPDRARATVTVPPGLDIVAAFVTTDRNTCMSASRSIQPPAASQEATSSPTPSD